MVSHYTVIEEYINDEKDDKDDKISVDYIHGTRVIKTDAYCMNADVTVRAGKGSMGHRSMG